MVLNPGSDLAEWARTCRDEIGMTQLQLAEQIGISTVQISKIENGRTEVKLSTLRRMTEVFGKPFLVRPEGGSNG